MGYLFPRRTPVERDGEPRVLAIEDDAADDVFAALSADTARDLLAAVYDEPRPASELAEDVDTSLQNARYHLDKLVDAGLVEVADTWYSERGTEMKVYAPANGSVAVVAGDDDSQTVGEALRGLLAAVAVLALGSVAVQWLLAPDGGGGRVGTAEAQSPATDGGAIAAVGETTHVAPGLVFFVGGLLVLVVLWLWAARRHPA